ncbi:MAG: Bug family tripartite tricarboxylate transporter substrate binding protein [Hylemonella sp.]|jgi:tripartite-type tricarboxylate transporter receptor subunit TctC
MQYFVISWFRRLTRLAFCALIGAGCLAGFTNSVLAQTDYPNRPVKLIVAFPPGGANDIIGRLIAKELSQVWGQQVVVENKGGANGAIGMQAAAKSPPDGYTLVLGTAGPMAMSPALQSVPYDPERDFTPIVNLVDSPHALAVHVKTQSTTVVEFVQQAKLQATKPWNYSSPGIGNSGHLAMELLKLQTGMPLTHIAYKGAGPALADLLAGHVEAYFTSSAALVPHLSSPHVRVLGVTSRNRVPVMPNVPTMAESGLQGFDFAVWSGLLGPAGMPTAVVQKINTDANRILGTPEFLEQLKKNAMNPWGGSPQQFATTISTDLQKWRKTIKDGQIKAE